MALDTVKYSLGPVKFCFKFSIIQFQMQHVSEPKEVDVKPQRPSSGLTPALAASAVVLSPFAVSLPPFLAFPVPY